MGRLCLVTGANGHLGNTLVRELLARGEKVRASVRNITHQHLFTDLSCEVVCADMLDSEAMSKALQDVDVLFHVAAVFKHWAKDPQHEIVQPNVEGTRIVLEAAANAKVKKIVFVSSVAAVGHTGEPLDESNWNDLSSNAYYNSKIESERLAWQLSQHYKLDMVSVLPSAIIGPNAHRLTDTMQYLNKVRCNALPFNPQFHFNFVDVRDVAHGMILAANLGVSGSRYILANTCSSPITDIIDAGRLLNLNLKRPPNISKSFMYGLARCLELVSKLTRRPADLLSSQVDLFYDVRQEYDISKAQKELGFEPRSPRQALIAALQYLNECH